MSVLLTAFSLALLCGLALVAVLALLFPASQQFTSRQKRQLARLLGTEKAPVTSTPEQYGDVFHAYLFLKQMEGWGLVKVRPGEELAQLHYFQVASAVILGLLALVLRLPLLLVPVLAVVGYWLPQQLANNAWSRMRSKVDEQLLTLVGEMAATVNFTTDPVEILRRAEVSLRGAGQEFLADELQRTLMEVHQQGLEAWEIAEKRAETLSTTLSTLYFILRRMKQAGGASFSAPFQTAAANLTEIIATRQIVRTKAEAGKSTMYMITGVFVVIIGMMLSNPLLRPAYTQMQGQLLVGGCVLAMAFGYGYIMHKIDEVIG